jgi:hypothetical protein
MRDHEARYAGPIVFAATLFSILTGLLFSVIVTRRISTGDYGILQFYSVAMAYLALPGTVIGYWLTRDLGRGRQLLTTGITLGSSLGILASLLLLLTSFMSGGELRLTSSELAAVAANLFLLYLSGILDSASIGAAPVLHGEGLILQELTKVVVGWILIVLTRMELLGVLLSIDAGFLCKCTFMYLKMPPDTRGRLDSSVAVRWLKRGWIPVLVILPNLIASADLLVLPLVVTSTVPTAYLGLARTLAAIILYANSLAITLYPKLLSGKGQAEIEEAFKLVMMFAVPMATGMSILALPIVQLFGQNYIATVIALQLFSVAALFNVIKGLSLSILQGKEGADVSPDGSSGHLLKSNLVVPRLWEILAGLLYVLVSIIVSSYMWSNGFPPESIVTALAVASLLVTVPLSLWMWWFSSKVCKYNVPWTDLASYVASAAVMSISIIASGLIPTGAVTVYEGGIRLFSLVALGALVYFAVLLVINGKLRRELLSTLKSKLRP